jgi:branched-chain amino acid transport system permease protein
MNDLVRSLKKNQTRIITVAVLVVLFVMAVRGMSAKDWIITTLRGLASGAVIFLVAAGFSLMLGLMGVLNLAQGTLYMIGAYVGWSVYVRPDTFVDLLTPLALLFAGFLLGPLWERLLGRLRLSRRTAQIWPWAGLVVALVILGLTVTRAPIAMWDPEVYEISPVYNVQDLQAGTLQSKLEPARFDGIHPVLGLGGMLLGSALAAVSLVGFSRRGQARSSTGGAAALPWGNIAAFLIVTCAGIAVYVGNDALTNALFSIDTTLLFLIAVVVATLAGAGLGGLMEATLIRPLYERHVYQLMMTMGLGFIGIEFVRAIWGRTQITMPKPSIFAGTGDGCPATSLGGWLQNQCSTLAVTIQGETTRIRVYNEIFVILVGVLVLIVIWVLLQRTRLGMVIRAGVQDSEMVEALGINVRQVFTLVFALGVATAALGGVLSGPSTGLTDSMGVHLLLAGLIALAIGGLTSYPGAALGSVIVGLLQQFIIKYGQLGIPLPFTEEPFKPSPPLVPASTVLLMVIVLLVVPQGLLGRKE